MVIAKNRKIAYIYSILYMGFFLMSNPYTTLGLKPSATDQEIKRAYRQKAKRYHPDVAGDDKSAARKFKAISDAYDILGDKQKRAAYDRGEINNDGSSRGFGGFGGAGFGGKGRQSYREHAQRGGGAGSGAGSGFGDFGDMFNDFFKRAGGATGGGTSGGGASSRNKGDDLQYTVTVDFESAARGSSRRIRLQDNRPLEVKIPAGIKSGQILRLKGKGSPSMLGGRAGDALVEVQISDHPYYTRKNNDIHIDIPITLVEAINGGKITVPTLHGNVSVNIPAGSNTDTTMRLKGKGIKPKGGGAGDQYLKLKVMLPEKPDKDLQKFVKNWWSGHSYDVRKGKF